MQTQDGNIWFRTFDLFTTPNILTGTAALFVLSTYLVYGMHLMNLPPLMGSQGQTMTGDYFAFYTGGEMVARGAGHELFNLEAQLAFQKDVAGEGDWASWNAYLNPPGFALLLALFTPLGFHASFFAYDALCVALFVAAAAALKPHLPQLTATRERLALVLLAVLSLKQIAQPMLAGQNTTITLSLLCLAYAAHRSKRPVVFGLMLGLLSYKPQFLLLLVPFLVLRREWVPLGVAGGVTSLHYALGGWFCGWDWPLRMLETLEGFVPEQREAQVHMSLPGAADVLFSPPVATLITVAGCAAVALALVRALRGGAWESTAFGPGWALLVLGSLLVSPHLNYYDSGVMVLPVLLLIEHRLASNPNPLSRREKMWLLFLWGVYPTWAWSAQLHVQPLLFVLLATFIWADRTVRHTNASQPTSGAEARRPRLST